MRKIRLILSFLTLLSLGLSAQDFKVVRGNCMPGPEGSGDVVESRQETTRRMLPQINHDWNPERTYHQLVILVSFSDQDFNVEDPMSVYDQMFNLSGYNQRKGPGCVADYYRDQSGGKLNLKFDVYGPIKVDTLSQPYPNPNENTKNYGRDILRRATLQFLDSVAAGVYDSYGWDGDFGKYDWNNNGSINQVIYVYAGLPGNISSDNCYGHIWPNTSSFTAITTHDGKKIFNYTCSGEHWPTKTPISCGIGTICHEFTHSLGLPDIYPVGGEGFSVVDEWDLMDGGNFTNYGWCPPEFTAMEKWLMGWLSFKDLTEPTSISGLKPVAEGGDVYRIKHSDSEWLLLENRQQRGWDAGAPGSGLVIYHVFYDASVWGGNSVNSDINKRRFHLVNADNMDYDAWDAYMSNSGLSTYVNSGRMNSRYLSTSPYPWTNETTTNCELTDSSVPSATMYENIEGKVLLSKPITNISIDAEGLASFDFMGGNTEGIRNLTPSLSEGDGAVYDLQGRRLSESAISNHKPQIRIVRQADGTFRKVLK